MHDQPANRLSSSVLILFAYGLLISLFIATRGLAHQYAHWIEGINLSDLPVPTTLVLPFIGLDGAHAWLSLFFWIVLATWPALSLWLSSHGDRSATLSRLTVWMLSWLIALFIVIVWLGIGLCLPFVLL